MGSIRPRESNTAPSPQLVRLVVGLMAVSLVAVGCVSEAGDGLPASEAAGTTKSPGPSEGAGGDAEGLVSFITAPDELSSARDVESDTVSHKMGTGLAPKDCTELGAVATEESHSWGSAIDSGSFVAVNVALFADAETASRLVQRIHEDIQDCDREAHPMFAADFEAVTDVDAADRAFVLSTTDQGIRSCETWAQQVDLIAHATLRALDPNPSIDQCSEIAQATARALARR